MSDPSFGLLMLGLIVVAIMMGYPTAFTLMGLGMAFGFLAFWIPGAHWYDNRVFDLIAQRAGYRRPVPAPITLATGGQSASGMW